MDKVTKTVIGLLDSLEGRYGRIQGGIPINVLTREIADAWQASLKAAPPPQTTASPVELAFPFGRDNHLYLQLRRAPTAREAQFIRAMLNVMLDAATAPAWHDSTPGAVAEADKWAVLVLAPDRYEVAKLSEVDVGEWQWVGQDGNIIEGDVVAWQYIQAWKQEGGEQ